MSRQTFWINVFTRMLPAPPSPAPSKATPKRTPKPARDFEL